LLHEQGLAWRRLAKAELAVEIGDITVPAPLPSQEQPASR
jgi:hypothetical protein